MVTATHPIQTVKITSLKSHPRQDELFGHGSDNEIEILAHDMAQRGLQHPIEILPMARSSVAISGFKPPKTRLAGNQCDCPRRSCWRE